MIPLLSQELCSKLGQPDRIFLQKIEESPISPILRIFNHFCASISQKGLRGIKYKNLEYEVLKWSIECQTRLIRDVKRTKIRVNLLIGLRGFLE